MKEGSGRGGAWEVIERVLNWVVERECGRVLSPLTSQMKDDPVPKEAYDRIEQLTFLAQYVYQGEITPTGRVQLSPQTALSYHTLVKRQLPEHPFLHRGKLANKVMASVVLAHAVSHDVLKGMEIDQLASVSHQPFLWRSIRPQLRNNGFLVDGRYVGYMLNSMWNDPVLNKPRSVVRSTDESLANVNILLGTQSDTVFQTVLPLTLYAQSRRCDVNVDDTVTLKGQTRGPSRAIFNINESTSIICKNLLVEADVVTLSGDVWLSADAVASRRDLVLYPQEHTQVGWGGEMKKRSPWNQIPSKLPGPKPSDDDMGFISWLVRECYFRFPEGMAITLCENFSLSWDIYHLRWVKDIESDFSSFIQLLVNRKLATTEPKPAGKGDRLVTIRFDFSWSDLLTAAMDEPGAKQKLKDVLIEARKKIQ
jgi:hypothetical protein